MHELRLWKLVEVVWEVGRGVGCGKRCSYLVILVEVFGEEVLGYVGLVAVGTGVRRVGPLCHLIPLHFLAVSHVADGVLVLAVLLLLGDVCREAPLR